MTTSRAKGRVFLSHSHQDDELARDLARRLRKAGLDPLLDVADLPAASDRRKKLREQIRDVDALLFLVTPAALRSGWMVVELGMADGFERIIVPVTAGLKPLDLPAPFQTYQTVPFDEVDEAISSLAEQLTAGAKE
jgi:hypothetical protein